MSNVYDSGLAYDFAGLTFDGYLAGLATQPVVGVFIAFNDGAYVAEPDWVEVTQYVRNINVRRGRGDDLQNFPSGSASVTLDNRLRLFDPFNTASIYNGKLKPRRQIKIVGQWAGVNYPMFRGYIAGWPVGYTDGGKDSTVQIDCFDALGLLAAETTSNDWAQYYTLAANPRRYWRCNDSEGSTVIIESVIGDFSLAALDFSAPPLVKPFFRESSPLANGFSGNAALIPLRYIKTVVGGSNTFKSPNPRFTFWMQATGGTGSIAYTYNGMQISFSVGANRAFTVLGISNNQTLGVYQYGTADTDINNFPFHVAVEFSDQNGNEITSLYINNVLQTFTSQFQTALSVTIQEELDIRNGVFQDIAIFMNGLTATQLTNIYQAGLGRINQSTINRFSLITSLTSFPASLTSFASSTVASVSELASDQYILQELQTVIDSENGELYTNRAGVLTFVNRNYFAESTRSNTPQIVFTDTGTGVGYDAGGLQMMFDADKIRNEVTVTFTGGGNQASSSSTSIAENGAAAQSVATYLATPTEAKTLADFLVTIYKNPKLRVDPFSVNGGRDPSYAWPLLLSLELLDRFTFKRTPTVGSAIQQDMLLQSVEHQITPGSWVTTVNGSARYTGWFTVGVSLIGGSDVLL